MQLSIPEGAEAEVCQVDGVAEKAIVVGIAYLVADQGSPITAIVVSDPEDHTALSYLEFDHVERDKSVDADLYYKEGYNFHVRVFNNIS